MAATSRSKFFSLFQRARTAVVGMVHVQALPGGLKLRKTTLCIFTMNFAEHILPADEYI